MPADSSKSSLPPLPNYFELFQNILNPFTQASSHPANNPTSLLMASLDPKEIARRQQELEHVLMWLKAQVGVIEMSLKTLDYQRSLLEKIGRGKTTETPSADAPGKFEELAKMASSMNPAKWAMDFMQTSAPAPKPATAAPKKARASSRKKTSKPKP